MTIGLHARERDGEREREITTYRATPKRRNRALRVTQHADIYSKLVSYTTALSEHHDTQCRQLRHDP